MSEKNDTLHIDADLMVRIKALASKSGRSFADMAESILRSHADEEDRKLLELADDEQRWQHYLSEGQSVPFATVRHKLRGLAAEAAQKVAPQ